MIAGNGGMPAPSYRGGGSTGGSSSAGSAARSYTVVSGDSLWAIASRFYGSGFQWQRLYQANIGVIGADPNLIYPGERLAIR